MPELKPKSKKVERVEVKELKKDDDFIYVVSFDNKPGIVYVGIAENLVKRTGIAASLEALLHRIGVNVGGGQAKKYGLYWEKYYVTPNLEGIEFSHKEFDDQVTAQSGSMVPYETPRIAMGYGDEIKHGEVSGFSIGTGGKVSVFSGAKGFRTDICPICGVVVSLDAEYCPNGHALSDI